MKVDSFDIGKEVLVIAEIGNNHEGSFTLAEEMIGLAADAGVGAVKFQTIVPTKLVSVSETERIKQLSRFQFTYEQFEKLAQTAQKAGLMFLSTPFDIESAAILDRFVPAFKISSGDNNFYPLLEVIAGTGKPVIMSTGLTDMTGVAYSKAFIENIWREQNIVQDIAILHCVSSYPVGPEQVNLQAINTLKQLGCTVGYSDHTLGIDASLFAVALGARIIEKHFTKDKNYSSFRDHQLSADPQEMTELVKRIKELAVLLGSEAKELQTCEEAALLSMRRSIVADRDISKGSFLTINDITWVRPGSGLSPGQECRILGRQLNRSVKRGEQLLFEDFEDL
ncbi:MAG: N-acetylneuraminate synthase family protein [Acidobacteriota bacterium]